METSGSITNFNNIEKAERNEKLHHRISGEGSRREPPTMGKQLVNFSTYGWESNAPSFAHTPPPIARNNYKFHSVLKRLAC
jgi:hypothetical protein